MTWSLDVVIAQTLLLVQVTRRKCIDERPLQRQVLSKPLELLPKLLKTTKGCTEE
jgi:hypothetical protein